MATSGYGSGSGRTRNLIAAFLRSTDFSFESPAVAQFTQSLLAAASGGHPLRQLFLIDARSEKPSHQFVGGDLSRFVA
jgi:hypothetical protein